MPRTTPTLAEIAADFRLWGEYYDVDGLDTLEQWEALGQRARVDQLRTAFEEQLFAAFDSEPCRDCGQSCADCCGQ